MRRSKALRTVLDQCDRATAGHAATFLPEFLAEAESDDPLASYCAAAAAVCVQGWLDDWVGAADLAERTVLRWADQGAKLAEMALHNPFPSALGAAEVYAGIPALPRVQRVAQATAADEELSGRWRDILRLMSETGPASVFFSYMRELTGPALRGPAAPSDPNWRNFNELERRRLWTAAYAQTATRVMIVLYDSGWPVPGDKSTRCMLAAALWEAGRLEDSEAMMLETRSGWTDIEAWETLPLTPVLLQYRFPLVTPRVRSEFLEKGVRQ